MELHQLAYFVAVAERLHFSRAAEALHVAQPAVSQQIRKLEAELGQQLFHRMKRRVALTPAGEALLPWARRILADVAAARAEVQELSGLVKGRLAVGATPSVSTHLLPPLLSEYHRRHPGIEFRVREAGSRDLVQQLEAGELDLAIIILPVGHPMLETVPLLEEELVVAVPPGHRLAGREAVRLVELRSEPFVLFREGYDLYDVTIAACRRAGFEPRATVAGGEMDSTLSFVASGLGVAIVPAMVLAAPRRFAAEPVRLAAPRLIRRIGIARRRDRFLAAAAREFIAIATRGGPEPEDGERAWYNLAGAPPAASRTAEAQ